ncbi:conserved oligomeric Golgi complex subunit 2 [Phalaenopsis equestris]|uniref:conserved oligomeric Golgi complex subunit 2 n=1 Tax=Phalaenopsis equestris TaxID=78828 RepID=UPI0009E63E17|nr:conserved oligomeric Golgi complex subunit 2 [Phalaenopsis equestris]
MVDLHSSSLPSRSAVELFGDPSGDSEPLWFKKSSFLSADFDPESYIADLRTFVPLESLGAELRSHLATLKSELVELINRDYTDFVSLSTRLVDVDSSVARMRAPLADFRDKVGAFRIAVDNSLSSLRGGLRQRAEASAAREILERLLDTFHVVSKVEKLIKELPTTVSGSSADLVLSNENSLQPAEIGTNFRVTQSILLERIASEMNRIKFSISNAKDLPFIVNMEKRIQNTTEMLDNSLGNCFKDGLEHHDEDAIYNCLRAYAAIDNTAAAEEIFRTVIVTPLIQNIIAYNQSQIIDGSSSDELEECYKKIKQCIKSDCKFILDISSIENSGLHVFDFLANSILKEILVAIQKGKPGAFSPGKPTEFLKNYKSSLGFLTYLEGYCSSKSAVSKFRLQTVYVEFMRHWNIGVYFSLRFQEIAEALDSTLMAGTVIPVDNLYRNQENSGILTLKQSVMLLESLRSCWSDDVLVISCADKFLRLSLQLISRYSTWLSSGLLARNAAAEDFIYVIHDVGFLFSELSGNYLRHVLELLESCSTEVLDLVRRSILQAATSLNDTLPILKDMMVEGIAERSFEDLKQLKGITATYRLTDKLPVRHSPYVSGILWPLKAFLDGDSVVFLTKELLNELLYCIAERITGRYYEMAADVVNLARKTESSLLRLRQGAQRRAGASSDALDNNISNSEKICMQLFLDIQEYGRNLASIGVEAADISTYRSLWQLVAPEDKQSQLLI